MSLPSNITLKVKYPDKAKELALDLAKENNVDDYTIKKVTIEYLSTYSEGEIK
jgi:hypothetical protein